MAEGRRSSRAHKTVNYAKLDYGSDEDDDFKPAEAPPSKRSKPSAKEAPTKKPEKKPKSDTAGATESSTADQKQKAGRASLDDKLFQRDLEAALRLSQNGSPLHADVREARGSEHNPGETSAEQNCVATFPDHLELASEVVVRSEPSKNADESVPPEDEQDEYQPEQEDSSEEEGDPSGDDSDEDDDSGDDDEEFAPTRARAARSSRKEPAPPKKSPATKKAAGPARATVSKAPAPPVVPCTTTKASTPARTKAQPSISSVVSPAAKSSPRLATTAKSSPSITSRPLPQRSAPSGGVPITVPKFSTGQLPASGIRLGLSRRSFSKPLHSAVKVQQ